MPKTHYLYHKLAKSVISVAVIFATITSVIFFIIEFERSSEKTQVMIEQLLDTVEKTAAIAAYSNNKTIGEDVLTGLIRNDIVHQARLSNDQGLLIEKKRATDVPLQAEIIRKLYSPFGDAEYIGQLSIVPEAQFNLQEARHSALLSAVNSTALIVITALIVLLIVKSSLSQPLMKVSNRLHEITAGEQQRLDPLPKNKDDELGRLVNDINHLLITLHEKFIAEHQLREEIELFERQLRTLFEATSAGIFLLDETGLLVTANPTLNKIIALPELSPEELTGKDFAELAFAQPELLRDLMRLSSQLKQTVSNDLQLKNRGQNSGWVHCLLSEQKTHDLKASYEGVVYDITERIAEEIQIRHQRDHDSLTGLLRRDAAERRLMRLINKHDEKEREPIIFLLDLDRFKYVNDTFGHDAGDQVLIETARRFRTCVRNGDILCRLGGDEFLIVLLNCCSLDKAKDIATCLIKEISKPIALENGIPVQIGVSIGIAALESWDMELEKLHKNADNAMYHVKQQGRNGYGVIEINGDITVKIITEPV